MTEEIKITRGFSEELRPGAASLFDVAFGQKLAVAIPNPELRMQYVHSGYGSTFEQDLLIDVERGVVKSTWVRHNGTAKSKSAPEGYRIGAATVFPRARNDDGEGS